MSDELVYDIDVPTLEDGLYVCTVEKMSILQDKNGNDYHVLSLRVKDGVYAGATASQWIRVKDDNYNYHSMNMNTLKSFMNACADGGEFEPKIVYTTDDQGNKYNPSVEGLEVGVYLTQRGAYTNVDRRGFVPISEMTDNSTEPF